MLKLIFLICSIGNFLRSFFLFQQQCGIIKAGQKHFSKFYLWQKHFRPTMSSARANYAGTVNLKLTGYTRARGPLQKVGSKWLGKVSAFCSVPSAVIEYLEEQVLRGWRELVDDQLQ